MDFMNMSRQEILDLGIPTEEYAEILKSWPQPKIDWSDQMKALRRVRMITDIAKESDTPDPRVKEEHIQAPTRDGYQSDLWVFRPKAAVADGISPLIVLFHGGGFAMGGPVDVADTARAAAKRFGAVVVVPSYRLAPEHLFPTAIHDGWDVLTWIARNAQAKLHADPSEGFIVGGESAGGSLSVVLSHMARDKALRPKITGLWLSAVTVRFPHQGANLEEKYKEKYLSRTQPECLNNPVYSQDLDKLIAAFVKGDEDSELYSPGYWPGEGHKNLPQTYIQLCGRDVNRDEGLIYRDMLEQAGVKTKLSLYKGLPHCFWIPLQELPEFKQWKKDCLEGFKWLLDF